MWTPLCDVGSLAFNGLSNRWGHWWGGAWEFFFLLRKYAVLGDLFMERRIKKSLTFSKSFLSQQQPAISEKCFQRAIVVKNRRCNFRRQKTGGGGAKKKSPKLHQKCVILRHFVRNVDAALRCGVTGFQWVEQPVGQGSARALAGCCWLRQDASHASRCGFRSWDPLEWVPQKKNRRCAA